MYRFNCPSCKKLFSSPYHSRIFCSTKCRYQYQRGTRHPNWQTGNRIHPSGYILVRQPSHPYADKNGYVREHRLVMESKLRRLLEKNEHVHHLNGIRIDNRVENLQVLSPSEHSKITMKERVENGYVNPPPWNKLLDGQWSTRYTHCQKCHSRSRRHQSHGLCINCYQNARYDPRKRH